MEKQECISIKTLAVTGKDLIDAGMTPGKELGETLSHFLDLVLEDPKETQKNICCHR